MPLLSLTLFSCGLDETWLISVSVPVLLFFLLIIIYIHIYIIKEGEREKREFPPFFQPHTPTPPKINHEFKASKDGESFMAIADIIMNLKRPKVCNMTLDELLDKISQQGMESLSDVEKQKLEEYSKSI